MGAPHISTVAGFLLAVGAAVCNGSFAAVQKTQPVQRAAPHPIIFNAYVGLGVVFSSVCVMPFLSLLGAEIKFNVLGVFSGMLFVLATLFSFLAIPRLGLALAQGVWSGMALLTAFLWGVLGPHPVGLEPKSWPGSLCGVAMLVSGVVGMVFHAEVASKICGSTAEVEKLLDSEEGGKAEEKAPAGRRNFLVGLSFAACVGFFGGSINVPSTMTKIYGTQLDGVETLPSFGTGTAIAGLLVPTIFFKFIDTSALQSTGGIHFRDLLVPGIISGTIWNLGNLSSVYANEGISFAVAQPMMQCGLLVSGMLGIFVFKEISGKKNITVFFAFAVLLLCGATVLALFGPTPSAPTVAPTAAPTNATLNY
jgi:glucose uptake protein GlcU